MWNQSSLKRRVALQSHCSKQTRDAEQALNEARTTDEEARERRHWHCNEWRVERAQAIKTMNETLAETRQVSDGRAKQLLKPQNARARLTDRLRVVDSKSARDGTGIAMSGACTSDQNDERNVC